MPFDENIEAIQKAEKALGYDPGPIDGLWGPRTNAATDAMQANNGRPVMLSDSEPPWITEGKEVWGLHETQDNAKLKAWLRSDGRTLGDPASLPWCGDFVETSFLNALPDEELPEGPLRTNPYWARNWLHLKTKCAPVRFCVGIFSRGSGGHVGYIVGETKTHYAVFGGNQSDSVNFVLIEKGRLLGTRWASTYAMQSSPLLDMSKSGLPVSVNEF